MNKIFDNNTKCILRFLCVFNKRKDSAKGLLVIRMFKTSMKFIEVFICLLDRASIAFVSTNAAFLGDTQTLLTTNKRDK